MQNMLSGRLSYNPDVNPFVMSNDQLRKLSAASNEIIEENSIELQDTKNYNESVEEKANEEKVIQENKGLDKIDNKEDIVIVKKKRPTKKVFGGAEGSNQPTVTNIDNKPNTSVINPNNNNANQPPKTNIVDPQRASVPITQKKVSISDILAGGKKNATQSKLIATNDDNANKQANIQAPVTLQQNVQKERISNVPVNNAGDKNEQNKVQKKKKIKKDPLSF